MVPPEIWEVFHPWIADLRLPETTREVYPRTLEGDTFLCQDVVFGR